MSSQSSFIAATQAYWAEHSLRDNAAFFEDLLPLFGEGAREAQQKIEAVFQKIEAEAQEKTTVPSESLASRQLSVGTEAGSPIRLKEEGPLSISPSSEHGSSDSLEVRKDLRYGGMAGGFEAGLPVSNDL